MRDVRNGHRSLGDVCRQHHLQGTLRRGGERAALLLGRQLAVQRDDVDVPHVPQLTFRERNLRGAGEEDQNRRRRADFLLSNFLDDGAETVVVDFEPVTVPFTARRPAYRSTTAPRTALR